jgi:hypothetical protein
MSLITADSVLLSAPRATAEQAVSYISMRGSVYTELDINTIAGHYWRYAPTVGLDPLLAIAQCIHETSEQEAITSRWRPLSSWWAQRPRRNPAGLGVTGLVQEARPPDVRAWALDARTIPARWRAGLSFDSWDVASQAHLGRLLAYAIPNGGGSEAQRKMIQFALAFRPLPTTLRGTAHTLKALGAKHNPIGQGWATPGDQYGARIAAIAQAITGILV